MKSTYGFCARILAFLFLSYPSLAIQDKDTIKLQSSDGKEILVSYGVAKQSHTLQNSVENLGAGHEIRLSTIDGNTLAELAAFMTNEFNVKNLHDTTSSLYERLRMRWGQFKTAELLKLVDAVHFLEIHSTHEKDVLKAALKNYAARIFSEVELLTVSKMNETAYAKYKEESLILPSDLRPAFIDEYLQGVNRIFLNNTPNRRIDAIENIDLAAAQIVAFIAYYNVPRKEGLPFAMEQELERSKLADKIHFGPMPIEWAIWPSHCSLPSDSNYNMYSDATPNDRYVDNGDGTVTDMCTRLKWEQDPSTPGVSWQVVEDHCAKLTKAGATDWRAPTRIELQSIVDYDSENPAQNPMFHQGIGEFWSSTLVIGHEGVHKWAVNTQTGGVVGGGNGNRKVRCVRGERGGLQSAGAIKHYAYAEHGETVTDNFTGQVWQRRVADAPKNQADAKGYCTKLTLEGGGWRLPTVKTLSTLVDIGADALKIDGAAFPDTPKRRHWSISSRVDPHNAWYVDFRQGVVLAQFTDSGGAVRCVR